MRNMRSPAMCWSFFCCPLGAKSRPVNWNVPGCASPRRPWGLIAETKTAVYTLQARQQLFRRLRLIVATNDAAADLARRQHQAGNIPDVELANQQALAAQARGDAPQTQAQLRSDRERLNRLMGLAEEVAWLVSDHLPPRPPRELSAKNLETLALAQHLDLEMARRNVVAVGSALALRTNTRYLPTAIRVGVSTEREPDRQRVTGPTLDLELPTGAFKGGSLREHIRAPFSNCCFRHP